MTAESFTVALVPEVVGVAEAAAVGEGLASPGSLVEEKSGDRCSARSCL